MGIVRNAHLSAARIVTDAGGRLVGRTRLQKVAYLSRLAGFGDDFDFQYRHYGPYSEDLARAIEIATGLGYVQEEEKRAEWGGKYSVFATLGRVDLNPDAKRTEFISAAAKIDAVELELAATAAFLYSEHGIGGWAGGDPWEETARLKPEKAEGGRMEKAKAAYRKLQQLQGVPTPLPAIA